MNNLQSLTQYGLKNTPVVVENLPKNNIRMINFKAGEDQFVRQDRNGKQTRPAILQQQPMMVQQDPMIRMLEQRQKEEKKAKMKQNLTWGLGIAVSLAFLAVLLPQVFGKTSSKAQKEIGMLSQEDFTSMLKDFQNEKSFEKLFLPKSLQNKLAEIKDKIARQQVYNDMNLPNSTKAMLLYGPPGTGKNTFTYALAKMFPDAKLFEMDMTKIVAPYYGVPEKNLQNSTNYALALANELKQKNKKLIVFLDEIDRVIMQDSGSGSKHSNDILTEFKRCFNLLKNHDNITIIGATNKEIDSKLAQKLGTGVLDEAMKNRFGDKIRVERPTAEALQSAICEQFRSAKKIDKSLTEPNKNLLEFCKIIHGDKHEFSFRTLQDNIFEKVIPPNEGNLTLKELINAAIESKNSIFLEDAEIEALKNLLTKVK